MERLDVAVIGAGQAGLSVGRLLVDSGLQVALLDQSDRVGDSWRRRWDSLRLFTPARYSALPGLSLPGPGDRYPGKDEVADYLGGYARQFGVPVRTGARVVEVSAADNGAGFVVRTSDGQVCLASQVVVATGPFQRPTSPALVDRLSRQVTQLHSHSYRSPDQLPGQGTTVVVGRGNSGCQIAAELAAAGRDVVLSGRPQPFLPQRVAGRDVFWWLHRTGMLHAPSGSWRGRLMRRRGEPVIGTDVDGLARAGLLRVVPRATDAAGRWLCLDDGQRLPVAGAVWATGYRPDYGWLRLPALDPAGRPVHRRGVSTVAGLYFIGLPWQSQRGSALLDGVADDARWLARAVLARASRATPDRRPCGYGGG